MMISVGLGRGFRGLTAIPVHAAAGRNRERSEAAQRSAGRLREGFLAREECRVAKRPGRGRNLTDPLKTRLPYDKGRLSAGPRAPAHPYATDRIRPSLLRRALPAFPSSSIRWARTPRRLPARAGLSSAQ
ncbi:hypothetical protein CDO26_23325 (plasmid) [Sinorhizobium meliloti]|nr:hypothetical protein CDO26_23325 [Sinorhizobium meliloti]